MNNKLKQDRKIPNMLSGPGGCGKMYIVQFFFKFLNEE
jgi:hypothetical protein